MGAVTSMILSCGYFTAATDVAAAAVHQLYIDLSLLSRCMMYHATLNKISLFTITACIDKKKHLHFKIYIKP
jgi:hypothetical protein